MQYGVAVSQDQWRAAAGDLDARDKLTVALIEDDRVVCPVARAALRITRQIDDDLAHRLARTERQRLRPACLPSAHIEIRLWQDGGNARGGANQSHSSRDNALAVLSARYHRSENHERCKRQQQYRFTWAHTSGRA